MVARPYNIHPRRTPNNVPASACIRIATTATGATTIMAQ